MKFLNVPLCIPYRIGKYSATKAALEVRKRWKENLMQINGISSSAYKPEPSENIKNIGSGRFEDTLLRRANAGLDSCTRAERNKISDCGVYGRILQVNMHTYDTRATKEVETERYSITWKPGGYLCIYDKERGGNEAFRWKLNKDDVQVDEKTGLKFLINDLGCGLFNMVVVDEELEQGLKEALDVSELYEKPLVNFSVQQDQKTGIRYITPNGFESSGGQIIMDKEAREKLDSLAKEYLSQYPNLVHSYEEAWFHATFEVRGLTKRTSGGIMQIGPNSITFLNKDGINSWVCIFDPKRWKEVKEKFDRNDNAGEESWEFWMDLFQVLKIDASLLTFDSRDGN
jgi:hypothetical protein